MDKITRFLNCSVPVTACNLRCEYCFVTETKNFSEKNKKFPYDVDVMAKALSVDRLGGACLINLCGYGETLLSPEIILLTKKLLENGHFVSIVTNGTITKNIKKIAEFPKTLLEKLFIKFSFHYKELNRLNLIDVFFENVNRIQSSEASFTVELVANDYTIEYIDDIKKLCYEKLGTLCHVLESRINNSPDIERRTNISLKLHQKIWQDFESPLFEFQQSTWGIKRKEFCYAGELSIEVNLETGDIFQCIRGRKLQNIYEDLNEPINFCAIGENCENPHCFISYVWLVLAGNIEYFETPTYAELRNRIVRNGEQWLKPKLKEVFEEKSFNHFLKYTEDKKIYINQLMKCIYGNVNEEDLDSYDFIKKCIEENLFENGIKKVAIYGMGKLGVWLFNILENSNVEVVFGIDKNYKEINCYVKCISPDEDFIGADAIIITPFQEYGSIKKYISNKNSLKTMSVLELVK